MAVANPKTFVPAEVLYAADLNLVVNTVYTAGTPLVFPATTNMDANGFSLTAVGEVAFSDGVASPTASARLRRNGTTFIARMDDSRTATTLRPWAIEGRTTGGPAAGLGVGVLARAKSADEDPSDFGALDFVATDITAGSEDTVLDILLRVAGAALSAAWRFATTTAFRGILTHANTADRTYTFPDRSLTVAALEAQNFTGTQRWAKGSDIAAPAAATVTITIATPAVVSWVAHGLAAGSTVVFTTTGALPTGLAAGTRYYVISAGLTADAFEVSATDGGAAINTTGAQSGTHTATPAITLPVTGNYFHITGTTAVTGLSSLQAGTEILLEFDGALTLTQNATSLILPGGASLTTGAGDLARFVSEGSANWRCVTYTRASGLALTDQLTGLTLSNNGADATNDIDIAVGAAASSDAAIANRALISLTTGLTKQLDAAWAVGTNQGGRDIGTIANASYHVWLITRPDTGVVDVLFSLNPGKTATITVTIASPGVVTWTAHGLQAGSSVVFSTTGALPTGITAGTRYYVIATGLTADAFQFSATEGGAAVNTSGTQSGTHTGDSGPVMPTNYTLKRRIGSIVRVAAAIKAFTQDGDYFRWTASVMDVSANNPGTAAVTRTLTVPTGVPVDAIFNATVSQATTAINPFAYISDLAATDEAPSGSTVPLASTPNVANTAALSTQAAMLMIRTNTSAQIRTRHNASDANTNFYIATLGWRDRRGRG